MCLDMTFVTLSDSFLFAGLLYVVACGGGGRGWLPATAAREVESDHRRAKNFRQRHQFLKALAEGTEP